MTIEKIKSELVENSINHYLASLEGDYKVANKMHKKLTNLYKKVKGMAKQDVFVEFLEHPNEGVRLSAATFLLKTDTELAINCLKKLAELPTITSMEAKMVLELWQKGELDLL